MSYIKLNKNNYNNKYKNNFGSICIPKNVPERIKEKTVCENNKNNEDIKYSYLDLLSPDLNEDEKYINYIQDSINSGKIIFGKKK